MKDRRFRFDWRCGCWVERPIVISGTRLHYRFDHERHTWFCRFVYVGLGCARQP